MMEKLKKSKWGVAGIFAAAAVVVGAELVPFDSPQVQASVEIVGGFLAVAVGAVLQRKLGKASTET